MSSLKMTFSLTSLILIIALGLVFVPTSVMAHLQTGNYDPTYHDGDATTGAGNEAAPLTATSNPTLASETDHTHRAAPTVKKIELVDVMALSAAGEDDASSSVNDSGTSVRLVNTASLTDGTAVFTDLDQTSSAGQFRVKITFSEAVYVVGQAVNVGPPPASGDAGFPANTDLVSTNILGVGSSIAAPNAKITGISAVDGSVARDGTAYTTFLASIEVAVGNLSDVPMKVWLSVNANAVFSKGKFEAPNDLHGRGNAAYSMPVEMPFTIVESFDTTAPTVEITSARDASTGVVTFTIASDEALGTDLALSSITVTGGTAGTLTKVTGMEQWTLPVTPGDPTYPATDVTITIAADKLADVFGNAPTAAATGSHTPPALSPLGAAPASISATAGNGQVTLTWAAVDGATGYQYSMNGGDFMAIDNTAITDDTTAGTKSTTVTGLTNGTPVTFQVRAVNAAGGVAASSASTPVTPMAPITKPAAPASIDVVAGDGQVTLTWAAVDGATSYQYSKDGGNAWADIDDEAITDDTAAGTKSITVTGLTNGTEVSFRVRGVNSAGNGAQSDAAKETPMAPATEPGAVTALMATPGDGQVMLSWTAPTTGGAITGYAYSNNGTDYMPIANSDAATTSHTVTGLTNGQTYTFTVRAVGPGGDGAISNAIVSTPTETPAPGAPAKPTAVAGDGKVTLTWMGVDGAGAYEYSTDGTTWEDIDGDDVTTNDDGSMSADITSANGTAVTFMIRGVGAGGNGAASPASDSVTPMMPEEAAPAPDVSLTVPAKSYVLVAKTTSPAGLPAAAIPANLTEGSSATTIKAWSTMPNLEDLFVQGGSLLLTTLKASKLDTDEDPATDPVEAAARNVLITEIMAARNTAMVGQPGFLTHQWIELYNNLPVDVAVTLSQKAGTPAPAAADTEVQLDLVSNVVTNARWEFTGLGADGSVDGVADTVDQPFVSFYRLNRGADGHKKDSWKTSDQTYLTGNAGTHVGTPGAKERTVSTPVAATTVPYSGVIINEVGNLSGTKYDWIELLNVTDAAVNVKNWHIGAIAAKGNDKILVKFPDDNHYTIPANGMILVVATDPYDDDDHPILAGTKWNKGQARLETPAASSTYYVAGGLDVDTFDTDGLGDGDYNLVIRSGYDAAKPNEKIIDLTGAKKIQDTAFDTSFWPLKGGAAPHADTFEGDDVVEKFEEGQVFTRKNASAGNAEHNWARIGFTGFGYKRSHEAGSKGSPGYVHDTKEKSSDLTDASVSISEIMYETTANKGAAQWIELYNNSATQAVNLAEWKLKLENADDADIRSPVTTNNLPAKILLPKQTVLIVSRKSASVSRVSLGSDDFPDTRIINLYDQKDKLEVTTQNYKLLSTEAFRITLMEKGGNEVDVAGNMGDDGMAMWALPASEKAEGRSSIIRQYDANDVKLTGTLPAWSGAGSIKGQGLDSGKGKAGWVFAADTSIDRGLYYGRRTDRGTPGFRGTGPLPVSLSKFRPERMKDTGEIVVRWATESELNNAGFNILRSEKRDGEFTKVHFEAGQGTTSERTAYEWRDTSAKPNVVYYYQIQDVSLDGEVTTLRTTHLRGNVTAVGKATTTWGEIKALQ